MQTEKPAVQARGITLWRGGRRLFRDLDFALEAGEALLVTGHNGAGKSSLLRLVAGLLLPEAGELHNPLTTALLAPELALKPDQTVGAELRFWAELDGVSHAAIDSAADAMAVLPLTEFRCRTLSSGQRQRVAIARTIASGARLWLLDEPTNALDDRSRHRLLQAIAAHRQAGGLVIAATHQPLPLADARVLQLGG